MSKQIQDMWDKLTVAVFRDSNHAFYGSLLCSLNVDWDDTIPCPATVNPDLGIKLHPDRFLSYPEETRKFILLHEIEHIARLHHLRQGDRDPEDWNIACDYEINLAQVSDGLTYVGTNPYVDQKYAGMPAEQIYDRIKEDGDDQSDSGSWGDGHGDMEPSDNGDQDPDSGNDNASSSQGQTQQITQEQAAKILNAVVKASQAAKMQGCHTSRTDAIDSILDTFLRPQVEWNTLLRRYLTDKLNKRVNWKKRNRRFQNIYLPSRSRQENGLAKISFYLDTSGSISDEMIQIFNSEVKFIYETFKPKEISLVQFDTSIRYEKKYVRGESISRMQVSGRGGTCLECVREHILETKPDIVVVLSDLECYPMEIINSLEIMWVVFDNEYAEVNQGKMCHVKTY